MINDRCSNLISLTRLLEDPHQCTLFESSTKEGDPRFQKDFNCAAKAYNSWIALFQKYLVWSSKSSLLLILILNSFSLVLFLITDLSTWLWNSWNRYYWQLSDIYRYFLYLITRKAMDKIQFLLRAKLVHQCCYRFSITDCIIIHTYSM